MLEVLLLPSTGCGMKRQGGGRREPCGERQRLAATLREAMEGRIRWHLDTDSTVDGRRVKFECVGDGVMRCMKT
jgi:hypothetical protein